MADQEADDAAEADRLADAFESDAHVPTADDFDALLPPLMAARLAGFRDPASEK